MASENYLFPTSLVLPKVQETLPEGYKFRPLERSDFKNGHLSVLADLCYMGEISEEQWIERFDLMKKLEGTYYILVIADESGKIVGTGSLMVEKKL
jgi:glucosamine-phosphate N-acetyltransferase